MRILGVLIFLVLLSLNYLFAQPSLEKQIQTQFIMVEDGGTIELPAGTINITGSLSMEGKKNVTIKGTGIDKTILSFKGQKDGAQGIKISNSENITMEDLTVQDALGDGIKAQEVDGISFIKVKTEWSGRASKKKWGLWFVSRSVSKCID